MAEMIGGGKEDSRLRFKATRLNILFRRNLTFGLEVSFSDAWRGDAEAGQAGYLRESEKILTMGTYFRD